MENPRYNLQILALNGSNLGLVTRMKYEDIIKKLTDGDGKWIEMAGVNELDNPIDFHILREHVCGFFLSPFIKKSVQTPQQGGPRIIQ